MLKKLGYTEKCGPAYVPSLESEYKRSDYILPVSFACLIAGLCAYVMILAPRSMPFEAVPSNSATKSYQAPISGEAQTPDSTRPDISLLLNGPSLAKYPGLSENDRNKLFAMLIISLAFSGSYIWSIQSLYRRLATLDLVPGAYYSIGIRIIFSVFVALLVYYAFSSGDVSSLVRNNKTVNTPAAVAIYAFLAGMFPQRWLKWIQEKFSLINKGSSRKSPPLPLAMIEGIGLFERTRLIEVGIENAQNLAKSNFIEIIVRTPFNPREVIDWIGQARLYLYFQDDINKLRQGAGIRTIFNLKKAGSDENNLKTIADLSEVPFDKLKTVYTIIDDDNDIKALSDAMDKLIGCNLQTNNT